MRTFSQMNILYTGIKTGGGRTPPTTRASAAASKGTGAIPPGLRTRFSGVGCWDPTGGADPERRSKIRRCPRRGNGRKGGRSLHRDGTARTCLGRCRTMAGRLAQDATLAAATARDRQRRPRIPLPPPHRPSEKPTVQRRRRPYGTGLRCARRQSTDIFSRNTHTIWKTTTQKYIRPSAAAAGAGNTLTVACASVAVRRPRRRRPEPSPSPGVRRRRPLL